MFDKMAAKVFNTTTNVMGYKAKWEPVGAPEPISANVHLSDPTRNGEIGNINYRPENMLMEYKIGDFPGLKEKIDNNGSELFTVTIDGEEVQYDALNVSKKWDGRTLIAEMQKRS